MEAMDGQEALRKIRDAEESRGTFSSRGTKIVMVTALERVKDVFQAFDGLCDAYLFKPVDRAKTLEQLREFKLI